MDPEVYLQISERGGWSLARLLSAAALVTDPAAQTMHESTFDAIEYSPAAHAMHELAPAAVPVSVIEPAWHGAQYDWAGRPWNWPAAHALQPCCAVSFWL